MLYLLSYDLIKPEKDYVDLIAYLKKIGGKKVLLSEWLVTSALTSKALCDAVHLNGKMDANDQILVLEACNNAIWRPKLDITDAEAIAMFKTARC